ncbi:L-ascorbate metabolism protein UlaG, beta-lactamase superfamily [Thermosyntropha lipolytica DSM 11003]|uniref:L-ascorbate metabolism protein UlaG, beta-lactamase superfamily n=1 Tax=Thermosyntropha lipolytica DSM 11003 TaxID=1123382 RepID=A0A1M5PZR9_9FIRM|nr:MBL fold metallo-hydrolase [Thermosyntropha lipolytica]SHH07238.1 L-ascorbate metabolism protein UlaG, beta-lactamase superfamily [Thermosyntropha lipolytica DSM 11003]
MKITWLGHASFIIETGGKKIITDPFEEKVGYPLYAGEVDIATVSHDHYDHNAVHLLKGDPLVVKGRGVFELAGIKITGYPSYHDKRKGEERGENTVYKIESEELSILHLGDLGHILDDRMVEEIGRVDILLIPVGGVYTINAEEAFALAQKINPRIIIPMHFATPALTFTLAPVEDFTSKFAHTVKKPYLYLERKEDLPGETEVIVLDYTNS